jgi:hypothetical protein
VAADRGCGVLGRSDVRFRAPERASRNTGPLGGDFAQETFRGETETISLGVGGRDWSRGGHGKDCAALVHLLACLPFFGLQDLDLEGNVTAYGSVAVGPDSHTRRRQCEPQIAAGGAVDEASITRMVYY